MAMIDSTLQDLRHAIRVLGANRTFAVLSVICLSLGIGTNTTVFTFVNALLLQSLIASIEQGNRRDERMVTVVARLADGVTPEMAGARLRALTQTLERMYPVQNDGWGVAVQPLRIGFSPTTRAMILMTMGAVTCVLLIACVNVANLTLARTTGRRREIATRLALGATRTRIVRQLLTESVVVAIVSIPVGSAFAYWGRALLLNGQARPDLHAEIAIDGRVLVYTIGLAMLASLLSGLLPALRAVRRLQHTVLTTAGGREDVSGPLHTRLIQGLIIGEISLALILLVAASLFVQSFRNALLAEGGFDTSRIFDCSVAGRPCRVFGFELSCA